MQREGSVVGALGKLTQDVFFFLPNSPADVSSSRSTTAGKETVRAFSSNEVFKCFPPTPLLFILASWKWEIEISFLPQGSVSSLLSLLFFFFLLLYIA